MCSNEAENTDDTEVSTEVKPKKRGAPQNLIPYTPETAKEASKRAAYCRTLRAQMRKKLLEAAVDAGIDKIYAKALKSGDIDSITVAREAMKLVGLDFASSEDAVQRTESKINSTIKGDGSIKFVIEDAKPEA